MPYDPTTMEKTKEAEHYGYADEQDPPQERRFSAQGHPISTVDDVFGEIVEDGPNYRAVSIYLAKAYHNERVITVT